MNIPKPLNMIKLNRYKLIMFSLFTAKLIVLYIIVKTLVEWG